MLPTSVAAPSVLPCVMVSVLPDASVMVVVDPADQGGGIANPCCDSIVRFGGRHGLRSIHARSRSDPQQFRCWPP